MAPIAATQHQWHDQNMVGTAGNANAPAAGSAAIRWPHRFDLAAQQLLGRRIETLRPWLRRDVTRLDADALHDFRVALRRLDSTLRLLRPLASPALTRLRESVHRVFHALGKVRDVDEQLHRLERGEALRAVLLRRRRAALRTARVALSSAAATRWPGRLARLLRASHCWRTPLAVQPARPVASALVRARRRSLRRALERLDRDAALARFHRARRRAKRCDDALADFEPWLGSVADPLRRDLGRLRAVLGALQDAVVAERDFRALAGRRALPAALRRRARELAKAEKCRRDRALRRALRAARAMSPSRWRRVRAALGPAAPLEARP